MTLEEKVRWSVRILRSYQPKSEPYYVCYSGGKDSDCIRILCDMAGVNYELHNNHTTVDAPETVYYIREVMSQYGDKHSEVIDGQLTYVYGTKGYIHLPKQSMWQLIKKHHTPPTRLMRYCCAELKEEGGKGRLRVTGVRKAESVARAKNSDIVVVKSKPKRTASLAESFGCAYGIAPKGGVMFSDDNDNTRQVVEKIYSDRTTTINPIVEWTDEDVWNFLHQHGCESNPLYARGYKRVGCIGCPMGGKYAKYELDSYPKYRALYVKAFEACASESKDKWKTAEDVYCWWVGIDRQQITLDDYFGESKEENK